MGSQPRVLFVSFLLSFLALKNIFHLRIRGRLAEALRLADGRNVAGLRDSNAQVSDRRSDKRLLEGKIQSNILSLLL